MSTNAASAASAATRLDAFQEARVQLLDGYRKLLALAVKPEWKDLAAHRPLLEEGRASLEEEIFQVIVFGEFKHGKSTFMNALLRQEICPMRVTPETAKVSRIHHVPGRPAMFRASGEGLSGDLETLSDLKALHQYVGQGGAYTDKVREIDIYVDGTGSPLQCGAVFVDTPGLRSVFADHDRITEQYINRSDAVIFFFDALKPFTHDEKQFLLSHPEIAHGAGTLYVLNRMDQVTGGAEERALVLRHVQDQLAELGVKLSSERRSFPQLFPISALQALRHGPHVATRDPSEYRASGFDELQTFLAHALTDRKGDIVIGGAMKKQRAVLDGLSAAHSRLEEVLAKDEGERRTLEKRRSEWERKVAAARTQGEEIVGTIESDCQEARKDYGNGVEAFLRKLKSSTRSKVKSADNAKSLQAEIPRHISLTCKDFIQEHDEALRRRLQGISKRTERALKQFQAELGRDLSETFNLETEKLDLDGLSDGIGIPLPAGGGGVAGAGIGFAVGGPIGAAIGAAVGGLLGALIGWFTSKDWRDEAWEKIEEQIDDKVEPRLKEGGPGYISRFEGQLKRATRQTLEAVITQFEAEAKKLLEAVRKKASEIEEAKAELAAKRRALAPVERAAEAGKRYLAGGASPAST